MATPPRKKIAKGRHASTMKRNRQSEQQRERNKGQLSRLKTAIKAVRSNLTVEKLAQAVPLLMKSARKRVIHRNKAARLVSRLARAVAGQKATGQKASEKKA
jgi:small subunit ribosomal protein S20